MTDDPIADRKRHLLQFPSPFPDEPGTVRVLVSTEGQGAEGQLDELRRGISGRPFIIDHAQTRSLFFSLDAIQSAMCVDDPEALLAAYTRKMMAFLLFTPAPRHVLMVGLGGGSLAKFCYRNLPHTRITVVEIDAEVIALRDAFAIPRDDDRLEIVHEDGAEFLETTATTSDIILIDAFDAHGLAPSLATSDFFENARRRLTPDGVLVMNFSGQKSRYVVHVENLRATFAGRVRLVPVLGEDNLLLFAFNNPCWIELPELLQQRAVSLEKDVGLAFSRYLDRLRASDILGTRHQLVT
jgi:spermidine synthase